MAEVIELKPGVRPPAVRLVLVVSSSSHPIASVPVVDRGSSRTFFATTSEENIALVLKRAIFWADARGIPNIYLRRDG
jgi:hypothetical protein